MSYKLRRLGIGNGSATFGNVLLLGLFVTAWGAIGLFLKNIFIDSLVSRLSCDMRSAYMTSVLHCYRETDTENKKSIYAA